LTNERDLAQGVKGEVCDVLGNFLPAATLTSLGISVSGEALPGLIRHLYLDGTPENLALGELIMKEAQKTGADQFLRHLDITEWDREGWKYLPVQDFHDLLHREENMLFPVPIEGNGKMLDFRSITNESVEADLSKKVKSLTSINRRDHDKLPRDFERVNAFGRGIMSFRGWRDVQRQGFCTHFRTYLTPLLGFYRYDKPAPEKFFETCGNIWQQNRRTYERLKVAGVNDEVIQYAMALGNLIGFEIGGNLRQLEFCNWQRSKFTVNHEVRQVFLSIERNLRESHLWWEKISRADMTPAYVFARTKSGFPLPAPLVV
jgi:hypothetical protein